MSLDHIHERRATRPPRSYDPKAGTFQAVVATETMVDRGPYLERLRVSPDAVDLAAMAGKPILDSHDRSTVASIIGTVTRAWIEDDKLIVEARLGQTDQAKIARQNMADAIYPGVSVGYRVAPEDWAESTDPAGRRVLTATRWDLAEISLVSVPADSRTTIRSELMTTQPTTAGAGNSAAKPAIVTSPAAIPPATAPAADATRAAINAEIRTMGAEFGLEAETVNGIIDRGETREQAAASILAALRQRSAPPVRTATTQIGDSNDDPAVRAGRMGEALYARVAPTHQVSDAARPYVGLTMVEMARETMRLRGVPATGLSAAAIITRSLHTTSDFSIILGDTVGRTLRAAYQAAPAGVRQLARQTTAPDFRSKHRIQLGEAPTLKKVNEHGEFTSGTMAEAKESYKLDSFGRIIGISRQAIVNDDLGAFTDLARRFGIAAAAFEAQFLVDLLTSGSGNGPTMSDSVPLFDATAHKNKAGSGGAPAENTLSAARLAMRKQTGLGSELIAVTPRYVLVPPDLETATEKLLSTVQATQTSNVNPFAALALVVEPRLPSTTRWYVVADPAQIDGLEYAYLEGQPGPQIESRNGFEIDGVQIKVRLDYGAGFVDWRGWYANAGA